MDAGGGALADAMALLDAATDLAAALRDTPKKDAGFSALTLGWILHSFEAVPLAQAAWT